MDRVTIRNEILVRSYFDDTGKISHYQTLLPQQLLNDFLQAMHSGDTRHPGITKMIQEARRKYYYPGLAKHIKKWVTNCEKCIMNKRIDNSQLRPKDAQYA